MSAACLTKENLSSTYSLTEDAGYTGFSRLTTSSFGIDEEVSIARAPASSPSRFGFAQTVEPVRTPEAYNALILFPIVPAGIEGCRATAL
jgi:hypothetical protein